MDRRAQLLGMFDASGFGLEIGPSYNPFLPKSEGYNIETLDHGDQATLRAHYARDPSVNVDRIEPVDYVSDGRSMVDIIGSTSRYDFILASHVIEHTPDLVGFLGDCERLLKPDGVLVLAVPDQRFCFDKLRPMSSLGEVVQAHHEKRTRHTMASLFDHVAYYCELNRKCAWARSETGGVQLHFPLYHAAERGALAFVPEYVDNHAWQFTPSSFRLIVEAAFELGISPLREVAFAETDIYEFQAVLSRSGSGPGTTREQLAARSLDEIAETAPTRYDNTEDDRRYKLLEIELDRCRTELEVLKGENAEYLHALEETRKSNSWRITAPIRAAARMLPRRAN